MNPVPRPRLAPLVNLFSAAEVQPGRSPGLALRSEELQQLALERMPLVSTFAIEAAVDPNALNVIMDVTSMPMQTDGAAARGPEASKGSNRRLDRSKTHRSEASGSVLQICASRTSLSRSIVDP